MKKSCAEGIVFLIMIIILIVLIVYNNQNKPSVLFLIFVFLLICFTVYFVKIRREGTGIIELVSSLFHCHRPPILDVRINPSTSIFIGLVYVTRPAFCLFFLVLKSFLDSKPCSSHLA